MGDELPKEFEKTSEVLPFTKYGLSTLEEFKKAENEIKSLEHLKKIGLTDEEIKLYQDNEKGISQERNKMETGIFMAKLQDIYSKIDNYTDKIESTTCDNEQPTTSQATTNKFQETSIYPEGHPMNQIKEMEESLFGHLKEEIWTTNKQRKMFRRFQRKKERILKQNGIFVPTINHSAIPRPGSLWDIDELFKKPRRSKKIGPNDKTMYTIKDNKVVRLEKVRPAEESDEYMAVDIVVPTNKAESDLLEGTKMSIDDLKKIDRFKDYEPGIPSKVLYLKNIAPTLSQEQLSVLFNQFVLANGGPVDVRLMSGRMRGQAFVSFQSEEVAIEALDEINGTILSGRPLVAQFGRGSNRVQDNT